MRYILLFSLFLSGAAVPSRARDGDPTIQAARLSLVFSRAAHGAVTSLQDRASGVEFVDGAAAQGLFSLAFSTPGDTSGKLIRLTGADAETTDFARNGAGATLRFRRLEGRDLTVVCTIVPAADDGGVRWALQVSGQANLMLEEVSYPILALRSPLTGDGETDAVVVGITKGGVYRQPKRWPAGKGIRVSQPGALAAQFGCYYSARGGLLSYTRDSRGYPKTLDLRRTENGLRWTWVRHGYQNLRQPAEIGFEIRTTAFRSAAPDRETDWRDGADVYKQWALRQPWCETPLAERRDLPDWLKAGPAMIRFDRSWLGKPERIEAWLSDYWRRHFPKAPLIVALWGWERVGNWVSPKYFPPYPSVDGFSRVVAAIGRSGGHAFPWPSGYYWNVEYDKRPDGTFTWRDWEDFKATGRTHALLNRDGTPLVRKLSWLRGGRNAVLCRGDPWTREWFNRTAVRLMELGCDMIQVDQVVGGQAPGNGRCFSAAHGHPPGPGLWDAEAFAEQLRDLSRACRQVRPDAVISIEEPQELYNHLIGIQDYRDAQARRWPKLPGFVKKSVFGYLYHEFLPVFQSNIRAGDRRNLAYCLVTGQIPRWIPHWPVNPAPQLANGGFETWNENVPEGWRKVSGWQGRQYLGASFRDGGVRHGGNTSLRLENSADDVVQVSRNVPIGPGALEPGRTYRLRAWLKVAELARENAIALAALTPKLESKGAWRIPFPAAGEWVRNEVEFTVPEGASFLRIMIHVNGGCRLWVDDLELEKMEEGKWRPLMHSGRPLEHDFVRRWVELFHGEGRPYLLLGRMLHPPVLLGPRTGIDPSDGLPHILANAFQAPDGSTAAIVVNAGDEPRNLVMKWRGKLRTENLPPWAVRLVRE